MVGKKILVVEDDKILSLDLKLMIGSLGYKWVGEANNFKSALTKANSLEPDIALIDINISGTKNGIQLAKALQENLDISVIFITSAIDEQTMNLAIQANPSGYIIKPFRREDIKLNLDIASIRQDYEKGLKSNLSIASKAIANLNDLLLITDTNCQITFISQSLLNLIGETNNDIINQPFTNYISGVTQKEIWDNTIPETVNLFSNRINGSVPLAIKVKVTPFIDEQNNLPEGYFFLFSAQEEPENPKEDEIIVKNHFFIKDKNQLIRINISEIEYIEAYGDYLSIVTNTSKFTTLMTMKKFESILPKTLFCRVHRSFIVNLSSINEININDGLLMVGKKKISIGDTYKAILLDSVQII